MITGYIMGNTSSQRITGEMNILICLEDALRLVLQSQQEWKQGNDEQRHKLQPQLAFEHFHHSLTVYHRGKLENVEQDQN